MSYFAKPNFIVYDEWFDDDLEKINVDVKNKKVKTSSNIHEFFYQQSKYKVGASENNFQLEINVNEKELITNNYLVSNLEKLNSVPNKKFQFFEILRKRKLKFNITKKFIYSYSIIVFLVIFGFLMFFISQSKKNESKISMNTLIVEKGF